MIIVVHKILLGYPIAILAMAAAKATGDRMGKESPAKKAILVVQPFRNPQSEKYFLDMVKANRGIIYRAIRRYPCNWEDADDLHADIVLLLWESFPGFRHESKPGTWISVIATHASGRAAENKSKMQKEYLDDIPELADTNRPFETLEDRKNEAMQHLDFQEREIVDLLAQDRTHKEIGEELELNENTVSARVVRIRQKLEKAELESGIRI